MVMDQFVTTYRKDYLWPYVRTFGAKPAPEHLYKPQYRTDDDHGALCPCHCLEGPTQAERDALGPTSISKEGWSRLGPMGPLLDPKIYPARVGSAPEVDTQRFNQPNVFLQKLERKYPYLYEVLRTSPPDDIIARINRDRLRTTYQVDFCKMQEYPSVPYDELLRSAGVQGLPPCPEPIRLPGDPCRPNQRSLAFRPATITKERGIGGFGGRSGGGGGGSGRGGAAGGGDKGSGDKVAAACGGGLPGVTPGMTEYQDAISRLGDMIIRDKIHYGPRPQYRSHTANFDTLVSESPHY